MIANNYFMASQTDKKHAYTPLGTKISKDVRNSANDPHVIEMNRRAKEMLKKCGFPKGLPELK